jgi:hypothetical protein
MSEAIEFWPDYGAGPLWVGGRAVDVERPDIPPDLAHRLVSWNAEYGDERLPMEGPGDAAWLSEGRRLLHELRAAVWPVEVVVTEPWWGEEPK